MNFGSVVLAVYAVLMLVGGIVGYTKGNSRPSLIAGVGSAVLLAAAWWLSRSQQATGFWLGAAVAALLSAFFLYRLWTTGKMMPAGGLLGLSVVAVILLVVAALRR